MIKKIAGFLVLTLAAVFIARIFVSHTSEIQASLSLISPPNIFLSAVMFLGYFYARALSWNLLVTSLGNQMKIKDSLYAWFAGESTRYIPGNVWSFASRFYLSVNKGIPKTNVILSMLTEIIILLPVSLLLSIPALWVNYEKVQFNAAILGVLIVLVGSIAGALLFRRKIKQIRDKLQNIPPNIFFTKTFLGAVILQIIAWSAFGLGNYFILQPFAQHVSVVYLASVSILAWFAGYISIVTPMGLGVREGAMILLLGASIGQGPAGLAAILSRVVLSGVEGVNLLFLAVLMRFL